MSGRYYRDVSPAQIGELIPLIASAGESAMAAEADIRPPSNQAVVRAGPAGPELVSMRWGLLPYKYRGRDLADLKIANYNSRIEDAAFHIRTEGSLRRRRCLVPASGWLRWTGVRGAQTRWALTVEGASWFMFAGLWDRCHFRDAGTVESFTILTHPSPASVSELNARSPVVTPRRSWAAWLAGELAPDGLLAQQDEVELRKTALPEVGRPEDVTVGAPGHRASTQSRV